MRIEPREAPSLEEDGLDPFRVEVGRADAGDRAPGAQRSARDAGTPPGAGRARARGESSVSRSRHQARPPTPPSTSRCDPATRVLGWRAASALARPAPRPSEGAGDAPAPGCCSDRRHPHVPRARCRSRRSTASCGRARRSAGQTDRARRRRLRRPRNGDCQDERERHQTRAHQTAPGQIHAGRRAAPERASSSPASPISRSVTADQLGVQRGTPRDGSATVRVPSIDSQTRAAGGFRQNALCVASTYSRTSPSRCSVTSPLGRRRGTKPLVGAMFREYHPLSGRQPARRGPATALAERYGASTHEAWTRLERNRPPRTVARCARCPEGRTRPPVRDSAEPTGRRGWLKLGFTRVCKQLAFLGARPS